MNWISIKKLEGWYPKEPNSGMTVSIIMKIFERFWNFSVTKQNPKWSLRRIQGRVQDSLQIPPLGTPRGRSTAQFRPRIINKNFFLSNSLTNLSSAMDHSIKPSVYLSLRGIFVGSPLNLYFLYVQGFLHPVLQRISLAFFFKRPQWKYSKRLRATD